MSPHVTRDFSSPLLACGRTRVPPDGDAFGTVQRTVPVRLLSFPRSAYGVRVGRRAPVALLPGQVLLPRPSTEYRRLLIDPAGERSEWLWVEPGLMEEIFGSLEERWRTAAWQRPLAPPDEWLHRRLMRAAVDAEPLAWESTAVELLQRIAASFGGPPVSRLSPDARQRDVAYDVITRLVQRLDDPPNLRELAHQVDRSPAHLCVLFRSVTGTTLSAFRARLRLSVAVDRLRERGLDLLPLALDLGFSSHSHFSARFRAAFGMTPSQARRELDLARNSETS